LANLGDISLLYLRVQICPAFKNVGKEYTLQWSTNTSLKVAQVLGTIFVHHFTILVELSYCSRICSSIKSNSFKRWEKLDDTDCEEESKLEFWNAFPFSFVCETPAFKAGV